MIEQAEAVAIATAVFDEPTGIGAYAFDDGFVLWAETPPPADPTVPPATVGDGCIVVDRETGAVSHWPPMAAVEIARRYSGERRPGAPA